LQLVLDSGALGLSGFEVSRLLKSGNPGILVNERLLSKDTLVINPLNLDQSRTEAVTAAIRSVLSG
jgi:hypothetical protein